MGRSSFAQRIGLVIMMAAPFFARQVAAQTFQHPGVLVSKAQLDYIKGEVNAHINPYYQEFLDAQASTYGSLTYVIQGPYTGGVNQCGSDSAPDDGCSAADSDSTAAYVQALLWYITGNQTYANNAIAIMNAYGHNLQGFAGFSAGFSCPGAATTCSNGPLQAAWDSTKWPRAAEIIRYSNAGWATADITAFSNMLTNVYEPIIYNGSGENGNWELSMIEGMMGIAVFNEDSALLAHAQLYWGQRVPAYFYYYPLDGNAPAPFPRNTGSTNWNGQSVFNASTSGVAQETCRDMKHTHYGISSAIAAAETDHIQGGTLYASQQARLISGLEFSAGIDVQGLSNKGTTLAVAADLCSSDSNSTEDNTITLGEGYTFVIGYNEYHNRLGQSMPNTDTWIAQGVLSTTLPVDVGGHMTVFEPLTHYTDVSSASPNFSVVATTPSQTVLAGASAVYGVTVTAVNGYTGTVTLSVASGLPAGATASFSPATVTGSGAPAMTVTTSSSTAPGSYSLLISGTDGTLTNTTTATLVVTSSLSLTITANNETVAFGSALPTLTYTVSPSVTLDTAPACVSSANGSSNVGVYPGAITCSGAALAGYSISYVAGQMTVLSGTVLTLTANNQVMTYAGSTPALTYTVYPNVALHTDPTCVTTTNATTAPGVYAGAITCSGATRSGYTITYVAGQMTVNAIAATITATNQSMLGGNAVPTLLYTSSPNGISFSTAPACTTTATSSSVAGSYPITCSGAVTTGYAFTYVQGTLTVVSPQNIWVVNSNGTLSKLSNAGTAVSPGSGYSGGSSGIAIDASGDVWSANKGGNSLVEVSNTGASSGTFTGGGLSSPVAVAVGGTGYIWVVNGNNSVSLFSNSGSPLSPSTGFTGGGMNTPTAVAVDGAGNLWIANSGNNSATEFLGASDPVIIPTASAAKTNTLGTRP